MQETNYMTDLFSALIKMGYQTNEYSWVEVLATEIFIIFISYPSRETFSIT